MVALSKARAFRQMLFLDIGILTKYVNPRLHDLIQFLGALHFTLLQAAPFFPPYKQKWEEKQFSVFRQRKHFLFSNENSFILKVAPPHYFFGPFFAFTMQFPKDAPQRGRGLEIT
jgi:hypothetical protein